MYLHAIRSILVVTVPGVSVIEFAIISLPTEVFGDVGILNNALFISGFWLITILIIALFERAICLTSQKKIAVIETIPICTGTLSSSTTHIRFETHRAKRHDRAPMLSRNPLK